MFSGTGQAGLSRERCRVEQSEPTLVQTPAVLVCLCFPVSVCKSTVLGSKNPAPHSRSFGFL